VVDVHPEAVWVGYGLPPATLATRGKPGKCGYLNTLRMGPSSELEQMLHGSQKHVKGHNMTVTLAAPTADQPKRYKHVTHMIDTSAETLETARAAEGNASPPHRRRSFQGPDIDHRRMMGDNR
jgi:hypothetical protein